MATEKDEELEGKPSKEEIVSENFLAGFCDDFLIKESCWIDLKFHIESPNGL